MSKRAGKRRRRGVVEPPELTDVLPSPPESGKKPRLNQSDLDGPVEEADRLAAAGSCSNNTFYVGSSSVAVAVSRLEAVSGNAPPMWSVEEVAEFLGEVGVQEDVIKAFKGKKNN